jgi:hypothetical protein
LPTPIIGIDGLLRLVEVVERLRATQIVRNEEGLSSWPANQEKPIPPDPERTGDSLLAGS